MRRLLLIFCVLIPLAAPVSAQGKLITHFDVPAAVAAGNDFWDAQGVSQPCARYKVDFRPLGNVIFGQAFLDPDDPCLIALNSAYRWTFDPLALCLIITHEIGHVRQPDHTSHSDHGVMRAEYNFVDAKDNSTPQCDAYAKTRQPTFVTTKTIYLKKAKR